MLCNFIHILTEAKNKKIAIPHFNINNLEWTKCILEECNKLNNPVILGVSVSTIEYIGGAFTVVEMIKGLIKDLNIKIPIVIHLDHAKNFDICKKCIDAGFTSVMIDGSLLSIEENIRITKQVVEYAHHKNVSVEAEVGALDLNNESEFPKIQDYENFYKKTMVDALAPAIGNKHGIYQKPPKLNYELLTELSKKLNIPLVLHGASGINAESIKKAIHLGIAKVNINTDLQIAWSDQIRKYIKKNQDIYNPKKIISSGEKAIKEKIDNILLILNNKKGDHI